MGGKATARFLRSLGPQRLTHGVASERRGPFRRVESPAVRTRFAVVTAGALALAACTPVQTVRQQSYPRLEEGVEPIHKVAVAPLSLAGELADAERRLAIERGVGTPPRTAGIAPADAAALVARYLAEAIAREGVDVTTPEDLARALAESGVSLAPREVARLAGERFGAQAVLIGQVARFRERRDEIAEDAAASVWFEVSLYKAPEGEKLWSGVFDETQRPLSQNVLVGTRYPGGGSRWLSVDELARWGAEETARSMPLGATAKRGP